jgi:phage antirepressor YoqD-like protein
MDVDGNITMAKVAKSLNVYGLGRNKLFKLLRDKEILRNNNEPYQTYVDRGYFKMINGLKNGFPFCQTLVTPKGMSFINKKLKEWGFGC